MGFDYTKLVSERDELERKVTALDEFLLSDEYEDRVSETQRSYLVEQLQAMKEYLLYLNARIGDLIVE